MTRSRSAEEAFGAEVRKAREQRGWTQEQLASYLRTASGIELSPTAMNRLELGKRPIRLNEVAALADLLGLGLRYGERDQAPAPGDVERLRRQLEALVARAKQLQDEEVLLTRALHDADARAANARVALTNVVQELRRTQAQAAELEVLLYRFDVLTRRLSKRPTGGGSDGQH